MENKYGTGHKILLLPYRYLYGGPGRHLHRLTVKWTQSPLHWEAKVSLENALMRKERGWGRVKSPSIKAASPSDRHIDNSDAARTTLCTAHQQAICHCDKNILRNLASGSLDSQLRLYSTRRATRQQEDEDQGSPYVQMCYFMKNISFIMINIEIGK